MEYIFTLFLPFGSFTKFTRLCCASICHFKFILESNLQNLLSFLEDETIPRLWGSMTIVVFYNF